MENLLVGAGAKPSQSAKPCTEHGSIPGKDAACFLRSNDVEDPSLYDELS